MAHVKTHEARYRFEAIDDDLSLIPLSARRVLDTLGQRLSLGAWRSLAVEDRWQVARAGAQEDVGAPATAFLLGATPAPEKIQPVAEPDRASVPREIIEALGTSRPLDDTHWSGLRALDRYVLAKCSRSHDRLTAAYDEIMTTQTLPHLTPAGEAHMVDVSAKDVTPRRAVATARVRASPVVIQAIAAGTMVKGDVVAVARVAGILAAKRTPDLIPLCHPVQTTSASIDIDLDAPGGELRIRAVVEAVDRTGVEMEAMVAASISALTVYDMIKSADRWASIELVQLEEKSGGKSGNVQRPPARSGR
ncbi:MAG TPA: cyclic pyranopterin monophosphate synthase MoaC [Polyangiaceae bacterium]|jgi:cyclic pyranopterin phosphate synthase|nr:cyclic pyranopterin monophosphate synthase MoaC [Polyangiaceae bacterium]